MRIYREAFESELARNCLTIADLIIAVGCSSATIQKAKQGKEITPKTVGRLAKALNVPVERLTVESKG